MLNNRIKWTFPGRYDKILEYKKKSMDDYLARYSRLKVLDAGCSNGIEVARLASQYPQHLFTGLDISKERIVKAKSGRWSLEHDLYFFNEKFYYSSLMRAFRLVDIGMIQAKMDAESMRLYPTLELAKNLDNLTYLVGDYEQLPCLSGSFDLIIAFNCGFKPTHCGEPTPGMYEFRRVMKKGGLLLSNCWDEPIELII